MNSLAIIDVCMRFSNTAEILKHILRIIFKYEEGNRFLHKPPKPLCGSGVVDMTSVKISDRDRFGIEFPGTM